MQLSEKLLGKLTQRNLPEESRQNIRTTNSYDSAGRLEYETVTREAAGTTNLYRTGYAYSYASYHRQVVRTEQNYDSGWVDDIVGQPSLAVILCQGQQITGRDARATGMERNNESQARMPAPPEARGPCHTGTMMITRCALSEEGLGPPERTTGECSHEPAA